MMREKVEQLIQENNLLLPGDRVLVGVSGGADSVCLLKILSDLATSWDLKLRVIHVNHGLRGGEAMRDQEFTAALADSFKIPCLIRLIPVREYVKKHGVSLEEAGRILRYRVFEEAAVAWDAEIAKETAAQKKVRSKAERECAQKKPEPEVRQTLIAVAHHGDDNVETILHNLFRGSGLKGMSGMQLMRGRIIRPLLSVTRTEIEGWLKSQGMSWCQDSTNLSGEYTRNRLRQQILPAITEGINGRAAEHILQTAERMRQADDYLTRQAAHWLEEYGSREENGFRADAVVLEKEEEIIQTYVIRQMLEALSETLKDLSSVHVEQVRGLLKKQTGKRVSLPYGMTARRSYDYLWIEREPEREPEWEPEREPEWEPETAETAEQKKAGTDTRKQGKHPSGERVSELSMAKKPLPVPEMKKITPQSGQEIPQNQYTKWFDYDKIKGVPCIRTRMTGDYFTLPGGGRKTVKSYFIDEKIPAGKRDQVPLLACGSHILWVVGYRISEDVKVTDQTKTILQVQINGGENNG